MRDNQESKKRALALKKRLRVFLDGKLKEARADMTVATAMSDGLRWNTHDGREATRKLAQAEGMVEALQMVRGFLADLSA